MKKSNVLFFYIIINVSHIRLEEITGFAGKSEIRQSCLTSFRAWVDVINLKREVENMFGGTAVLTAKFRSLRNSRVEEIHAFTVFKDCAL